jgi:hypothetical protein
MMTDQYCLLLDPHNPSCLKAFSFFLYSAFNADVSVSPYPYLGLSPSDDLNGPSYVQALNLTGNMRNSSLSYQLGDWPASDDKVGNDNITFGGNVEGAYGGILKRNLILASSEFLYNINFQGCSYNGVCMHRNESWIYGSIDPLMYYIGLPKFSYQGIECESPTLSLPFSNQCVFKNTDCE